MRWEIAFTVMVWFLHISHVSTDNSNCPITIDDFSPESDNLNSLIMKITHKTEDCLLKIATDYDISTCWFYPCLLCQSGSCCTSISCSCSVNDIVVYRWLTCSSLSIQRECPPGRDKKYTCQTIFYQNTSAEPLNGCSNGQKAGDFVLVLQLNAKHADLKNGSMDTAILQIMCNSISVTSNAPRINTTIESRTTTTVASSRPTDTTIIASSRPTDATITTLETSSATPAIGSISVTTTTGPRELIIGIVVGVGGGILLTIAIVVIVVLRKRRSESNKFHAKDASQVDAAVACETPSTNYTIPVPAAYDNAVNGTSLSYQSIVYDNEHANALNEEYSEVRKPEAMSNDAFYDNSEARKNETHSISDEMAKDYDNANEDPAANNETIVIDNEFYG